MAYTGDLEGFSSSRYFSRSLALFTLERGWLSRFFLLCLISLIPIIGWILVLGYVAEWARLTAWTSTSNPHQQNMGPGIWLSSGFRVFLILIIWSMAESIVYEFLLYIPGISVLVAYLWLPFGLFLGTAYTVSVVRATIYKRIRAGFRINRMWEMIKQDPVGLIKITLIALIFEIVMYAAVVGVLAAWIFSLGESELYGLGEWMVRLYSSGYTDTVYILQHIMETYPGFLFALAAVYVIYTLFSTMMNCIVYIACGLWFRQFNVAAWGEDSDPLPQTLALGEGEDHLLPPAE